MDNVVWLEFGSFSLYWYGVFMAAAVLLTALAFSGLRKLQGHDFLSGLGVAVVCMPAALVCGRVFYCWFAKASFTGGIADVLNLTNGGNALYGALGGVAATMIVYSRLRQLSLTELLDAAAPAVSLGIAVGRFAGIVSGDDIGFQISAADAGKPFAIWSESDGAWILWVGYFEGFFAALTAVITLSVFFLHYYFKKPGVNRGNTVLAFMTVYGLSQTILESMRNDSLFMVTLGFVRISQIISIVLALASLVVISVSICRLQRPRTSFFVAWMIIIAALTAAIWSEVKMSASVIRQNYIIMGVSLAIIFAVTAYLFYCKASFRRSSAEAGLRENVSGREKNLQSGTDSAGRGRRIPAEYAESGIPKQRTRQFNARSAESRADLPRDDIYHDAESQRREQGNRGRFNRHSLYDVTESGQQTEPQVSQEPVVILENADPQPEEVSVTPAKSGSRFSRHHINQS